MAQPQIFQNAYMVRAKKNREIKSKSISRNFLAEKFQNCPGQKILEISRNFVVKSLRYFEKFPREMIFLSFIVY